MTTDHPYLVEGTVNKTRYLEAGKEERVTRLVMASSEEEAKNKFKAFYESKTVEFEVYYDVWYIDVHPTIW